MNHYNLTFTEKFSLLLREELEERGYGYKSIGFILSSINVLFVLLCLYVVAWIVSLAFYSIVGSTAIVVTQNLTKLSASCQNEIRTAIQQSQGGSKGGISPFTPEATPLPTKSNNN